MTSYIGYTYYTTTDIPRNVKSNYSEITKYIVHIILFLHNIYHQKIAYRTRKVCALRVAVSIDEVFVII